MTNKDLYKQLCKTEKDIPVFSQYWWLDALCGNTNWDVAIVEKGGRILGTMPYFIRHKHGLTMLIHPPLTQTLGPWIRPGTAKYAKTLASQKDVLQTLIDQLPDFDTFGQNWHYTNTNWLPFYWRGFQQTTLYTYILPNLSNEQQLWSGMLNNIRTDIRKAEGRYRLIVRDDLGLESFLRLNRMTFQRQGKNLPYPESLVHCLDKACSERNCRKIWIAEDDKGRHHAGVYVIWDENSAYYLMGGGDPELRNSGATSLCMWTAIRYAATVTRCFNFEGSMIEPIERFFRSFGAIQIPYFHISKTPSRLLRFRQYLLQGIKNV